MVKMSDPKKQIKERKKDVKVEKSEDTQYIVGQKSEKLKEGGFRNWNLGEIESQLLQK